MALNTNCKHLATITSRESGTRSGNWNCLCSFLPTTPEQVRYSTAVRFICFIQANSHRRDASSSNSTRGTRDPAVTRQPGWDLLFPSWPTLGHHLSLYAWLFLRVASRWGRVADTLDHVILDQSSRNNGADHRLLALIARVTGKLGDAPPAAQMTELALHGTKQYIA